ncbi:MAG: transcription termination factor NusA, partial [Leptonema sp. (in: bacteria)]
TITIYESFENINRIDASTINRIFKQKLKDLEFEMTYEEFKDKKGEILTAQYSFSKGKDVIVSFDKGEGILPKSEQMPKDKYGPGKHFKVVIKDILLHKGEKDSKPLILVSRASAEFVKALLKQEVVEIQDRLIEIINAVREPGFRTKMIIKSNRFDIDPLGACVGPRGTRIQSIIRELHSEKVDLVVYSDNPANMISQALSPAKVSEVHVDTELKEALVVVPDYEFNKAIGPNGKNVKLASLLVGYKINIKSEKEFREAMSSPEIRKKLEELFRVGGEEQEDTISEETSLKELPGLTKRVRGLLEAEGINSIEKLIGKTKEDLLKIPGINKTTAEHILKILQENVEIEEEGEE